MGRVGAEANDYRGVVGVAGPPQRVPERGRARVELVHQAVHHAVGAGNLEDGEVMDPLGVAFETALRHAEPRHVRAAAEGGVVDERGDLRLRV